MAGSLIEDARTRARPTMDELAARAHTSRPTLSAYEHGRKSPRLDTAERIIGSAGFTLTLEPTRSYRTIRTRHRRPASVPERLPRLPVANAARHGGAPAPPRLVVTGPHGRPPRTGASAPAAMRWCCEKARRPTSTPTSTVRCSWTCGTTSSYPPTSGERGET